MYKSNTVKIWKEKSSQSTAMLFMAHLVLMWSEFFLA